MNQNSSGFEKELNKVKKALESEQKKCSDMGVRVEELETEFGEREEELLNKLREAEEDLDRLTEQANHRVRYLFLHISRKMFEGYLTLCSISQTICFSEFFARFWKK
jgi:predicted  nucleic acid-binding Zn-ribbon protein